MNPSENEIHVQIESNESEPFINTSPDVQNEAIEMRPVVNEGQNVEAYSGKQELKNLEASPKTAGDHNHEIRSKRVLHEVAALKKDNYKRMKNLLSSIDDETLFEQDNEGKTALHVAVENDHKGCCNAILMKSREALSQKDFCGNTPLHCVVKLERNELCKTFMKHCTAEMINLSNNESLTSVHVAAIERNPEIMKLLLDNGGNPRAVTKENYTPLHFAAKRGSYWCVYLLLEAFPPADKREYMNMVTNEGMTALMLAATQNLQPICKLLIHTDVNLKSKEKKTALHYAAQRNSIKIVKCIVESILKDNVSEEYKKEKMPFEDEEFTFLCLKASIKGKSDECLNYFFEMASNVTLSFDSVKQLVDMAVTNSFKCIKSMCCRPEFQDYLVNYRGRKGNTLLHLAIMNRSYGTAKALIVDLNFDKLAKNMDGDSALHLLAGQSYKASTENPDENWNDVLRELATSSHELVNATNGNGETPLLLASGSGNIEIVKALLQKEPNILRENKEGKTAIHSAAENGHTSCLKLLLRSLKTTELEQLRHQRNSYPLHLASGKGHAECCKLLLSDDWVGDKALKNLWSKDGSGHYPVDKAFKGGHSEIFYSLLSKMEFNEQEEEFSVRLHHYFKKSLLSLPKNRNVNYERFYAAVLSAVIESSWCKVVFDGRFCSSVHPQLLTTKEQDKVDHNPKPCDSFGLLIENHPTLACRAMNKHITPGQSQKFEDHDYSPFEFIYYAKENDKPVSPFIERSSSGQKKSKVCWGSPKSSAKNGLRTGFQEFEGVSWYEDHPLQKAVSKRYVEVLRHNLTRSWLEHKLEYAILVLYPYVVLDIVTAVFAVILQSFLWNDHHLRASFSGATRQDVTAVYNCDVTQNSSVADLVQAVRSVAVNDSHCATWGASSYSSESEPMEPGSAAWNRSVCTIYHLQEKSPRVITMEAIQIILILLHSLAEFSISHKKPKVFVDLHRISRKYIRIPAMACLLIFFSSCDFVLGCRQTLIWQVEVVAVLLICVHVVLILNKMPRFSGFMPVTPQLFMRYALSLFPLLVFLIAFSIAFHFLLRDNLSFKTIPYSLVKTLTLMLGDLGYDDLFVNDEYPTPYPLLSNILFVVFIIGVGGLLLNFVVGSPQEKLSQLGDEDELNRAIVHLQLHLFIDECAPKLRRRDACSRAQSSTEFGSHIFISSGECKPSKRLENDGNLGSEILTQEIASIKKDVKVILKRLQLSESANDLSLLYSGQR